LRDLATANVEGDDHAARRQIQLYRQAETPSRTHRGRITSIRGVGKKECRAGAWATVNERPAAANKSGSGRAFPTPRVLETRRQDRRTARRPGFRKPSGRGAIALRKKSRRNTQAKRNGEVGSAKAARKK